MYSFSPHSLPTIAAPGQPARAGARVRTHGPRRRPRSPFLAAVAAAALHSGLAPSGDSPPSERGGPERPWSLLSAAGGRVATFVIANRPTWFCSSPGHAWCWWLSPRVLLPPPALASFLSLLPPCLWATPPKGLRAPGRARGLGRAATMQPRRSSGLGGGGEPGGVRVCKTRGCGGVGGVLAWGCGSGRDPRGQHGWPGAQPTGTLRPLACSLAARARALFTSEAWT